MIQHASLWFVVLGAEEVGGRFLEDPKGSKLPVLLDRSRVRCQHQRSLEGCIDIRFKKLARGLGQTNLTFMHGDDGDDDDDDDDDDVVIASAFLFLRPYEVSICRYFGLL